MLTVLAYAIPYLFTIGLALGVAAAGLLQYRIAARLSPEFRISTAVLIVGVGALLSVALTSRTLDEDKIGTGLLIVTSDDLAGGFTASRWLSLLLVSVSMIEVARGWVRDRHDEAADPARALLFAMLAFHLGTMFVQVTASDHPGFSLRDLYVPIVLTAIYYQRPQSLAPILSTARWTILVLTLGSLLAVWSRPDFAIHRPDLGWIPGLDWRLFGLAPHANSLGPIALLGILIELQFPSRWRMLGWLNLLASGSVFVLAQSKTAWGAVPLMILFVALPLTVRRSLTDGADSFRRAVWTLSGAIVVIATLAAAFVAFDAFDFIQRHSDLVTLTGRTQIWEITLRAWRENMLFGYGPGIWGAERQLQFHMFHVGHAHNQIVQSLGEAGLVGTLLLLLYLGALFRAALGRFVASRGLVLMLLMLVLVRCVTEAPMSRQGLLSWDAFLQVLLLATACYHVRRPRVEAPGRVLPPRLESDRERAAAPSSSRFTLHRV